MNKTEIVQNMRGFRLESVHALKYKPLFHETNIRPFWKWKATTCTTLVPSYIHFLFSANLEEFQTVKSGIETALVWV